MSKPAKKKAVHYDLIPLFADGRKAKTETYVLLDELIQKHHPHLQEARIAMAWRMVWKPDVDQQAVARFWALVDRTGGTDACWLWTGCLNSAGYGQFRLNRKAILAHRLSLVLAGRNPGELVCDHLCRCPRCVNPRHIEIVTHRENSLRGNGCCAQHARKITCFRGHSYDDNNTIRTKNGRECRTCRQERDRQRNRNPRRKEQMRANYQAYLARQNQPQSHEP